MSQISVKNFFFKFAQFYVGDSKVADVGAQETSSVVVETVAKVAKNAPGKGPVLPAFKSDASKVSSKGMGLKKAYIGKQNQFTVNAADAGLSLPFFLVSI